MSVLIMSDKLKALLNKVQEHIDLAANDDEERNKILHLQRYVEQKALKPLSDSQNEFIVLTSHDDDGCNPTTILNFISALAFANGDTAWLEEIKNIAAVNYQDHPDDTGCLMNNLGVMFSENALYEKSEECFAIANECFEHLQDRLKNAVATFNLGIQQKLLGNYHMAGNLCDAAASLCHDGSLRTSDVPLGKKLFTRLADILQELGKYTKFHDVLIKIGVLFDISDDNRSPTDDLTERLMKIKLREQNGEKNQEEEVKDFVSCFVTLMDQSTSAAAELLNTDFIKTVMTAATIYSKTTSFEEASKLLEKLEHTFLLAHPRSDPLYGFLLYQIGCFKLDFGKFNEAERALKQAEDVLLTHYRGRDHHAVASCKSSLGSCALLKNNTKEASKHLKEAVNMFRKNSHKHPEVAKILLQMALLYVDERDFSRAHKAMQEAIDIFRSSCGEISPMTASAHLQVGMILQKVDEFQSLTVDNMTKAIQILSGLGLGPDHPDVKLCQSLLSEVEQKCFHDAQKEVLFLDDQSPRARREGFTAEDGQYSRKVECQLPEKVAEVSMNCTLQHIEKGDFSNALKTMEEAQQLFTLAVGTISPKSAAGMVLNEANALRASAISKVKKASDVFVCRGMRHNLVDVVNCKKLVQILESFPVCPRRFPEVASSEPATGNSQISSGVSSSFSGRCISCSVGSGRETRERKAREGGKADINKVGPQGFARGTEDTLEPCPVDATLSSDQSRATLLNEDFGADSVICTNDAQLVSSSLGSRTFAKHDNVSRSQSNAKWEQLGARPKETALKKRAQSAPQRKEPPDLLVEQSPQESWSLEHPNLLRGEVLERPKEITSKKRAMMETLQVEQQDWVPCKSETRAEDWEPQVSKADAVGPTTFWLKVKEECKQLRKDKTEMKNLPNKEIEELRAKERREKWGEEVAKQLQKDKTEKKNSPSKEIEELRAKERREKWGEEVAKQLQKDKTEKKNSPSKEIKELRANERREKWGKEIAKPIVEQREERTGQHQHLSGIGVEETLLPASISSCICESLDCTSNTPVALMQSVARSLTLMQRKAAERALWAQSEKERQEREVRQINVAFMQGTAKKTENTQTPCHADAYFQVPLIGNPSSFLSNRCFGTYSSVESSHDSLLALEQHALLQDHGEKRECESYNNDMAREQLTSEVQETERQQQQQGPITAHSQWYEHNTSSIAEFDSPVAPNAFLATAATIPKHEHDNEDAMACHTTHLKGSLHHHEQEVKHFYRMYTFKFVKSLATKVLIIS